MLKKLSHFTLAQKQDIMTLLISVNEDLSPKDHCMTTAIV